MLTYAFYKGRRRDNPRSKILDRLICWWHRSRGKFSHVEIVGESRGADGWQCWSSSFRDGGVRPKDIDVDNGRWIVVQLPTYPPQPALDFIKSQEDAPYDVVGILGFIIPWIKQIKAWWYCSEICARSVWSAADEYYSLTGKALGIPVTDISPTAFYEWCVAQPGAVILYADRVAKK